MSFVILIVCLVAAAWYDVWDVARQRKRRGAHARATTSPPRQSTPVPSPTEPGFVEQMVTGRLLSGQLDSELYRDCMAAIASTVDKAEHPESPLVVADDDSVDRLVAALPELPSDTVRAAADLAQLGASVEDLVRLLDLTAPQALRVVVVASGAPH